LHFWFFTDWTKRGGTAALATDTTNFAPLENFVRYVRLLLFPVHLHMGHSLPVYPTPWHAGVLGGFALIVLGILQVLRERPGLSLPISWGLCWFAAALFPSFSTDGTIYDHWLYLPSVGLFLGLAQSLALRLDTLSLEKSKLAKCAVTIIALLASLTAGLLTYRQNTVWRDPVVLYNNILASGELAPNAHINLGNIDLENGCYEKAIYHFRHAILVSGDSMALAQSNLAVALLSMPNHEMFIKEGLAHFHRALEINPEYYPALNGQYLFYKEQGDLANAALYQNKAEAIVRKVQRHF
jgi:tetratricopeptide (TPR) repeat protein